jgi:3-hydroxyisobutyrate dehydrogenase
MNVSFLGLGAIGTPMARHLADATTLTVWNRTRAKAEEFAAAMGARCADTPADAAKRADFLVTCLPTSREVEDVLFGDAGAVSELDAGTMVIDCTSGDPTASQRIAGRLGERQIGFIDAPVSGGTAGAEAGTLTVMCGGDAAAVDRARPVLDAFAGKIVRCGPVGAGHAVKAVNNALLAVHVWSTAEGLAILRKLGVDPAVALEVINASSGRSFSSIDLFPSRVLNRTFPRTFRLALLDKDTGIAANMARETRTPADILELTSRLFAKAHHELGDEADHVEAVRVVEKRTGTTIE